ncbi:MAG: T9SS type A sorting domain-containing protein [Bacteroidetes bacterium]|nr:T9SS type A sorting domain-containing protein [Bacteroidota bacterium]
MFTVLPAPQILLSPSGNVSACQGDTITLQTTPGSSGYLWSTGSTNTFIDVTTSGTYTVTVSGTSSSCVASSSASFIFNPLPTIALTANGPTNFCVGDSILMTATGSSGNYQWLRNQIPIPGANSSSFMVKGRGFYQCIITDSNGCSNLSNTLIVRTPCVPPQDPIDKIQVSSDELQLVVFPNPGSGQFTFEVIGDIIPKAFSIIDLSGRELFSETLKEHNNSRRYHFDISNYPSGVHILMVTDEEEKLHRLKLIKLQ